ncbi:MAG: hypothetical protein HONBIEJF_01018 [Fimbriimonadaceae bacterium]|nr:hypothetical protein [Fimbriimonadaceae bacterium]
MALVYAILIVGAVTTLYPFLLMVGTSLTGPTDQNENRIVPAYFGDNDKLFEKYLNDKYAGDLSLIAATRTGQQAADRVDDYSRWLMELPLDWWVAGFRTAGNQVTGRLAMEYQAWLRTRYLRIRDLNIAYLEENTSFQTVVPPVEWFDRRNWKPVEGRKWSEWLEFKQSLPAELRIPIAKQRLFQEWLRGRHENQFSTVPADVRGNAKTFETVALPLGGDALAEFERVSLHPRFAKDWPERRFGGPLPIEAFERTILAAEAPALKREFATRNYRYVLDYILVQGRAVLNTVIFCGLAVLTHLIVNPLAAYALSRFHMPATAKILLFLLATMAFPAEVAMIPSFLLLKDLGLLNTFAALVLPTAASGYMIYLLKGFFDSLPAELFESGQIDGAREGTMLWKIALPLSKPVLGYISLIAFMSAYGAFMYAFLVAQDRRMWTLMVWIYQMQQSAPKAVIFAALTIAALPTLIVFLLAQRVIMRGIILPGER